MSTFAIDIRSRVCGMCTGPTENDFLEQEYTQEVVQRTSNQPLRVNTNYRICSNCREAFSAMNKYDKHAICVRMAIGNMITFVTAARAHLDAGGFE